VIQNLISFRIALNITIYNFVFTHIIRQFFTLYKKKFFFSKIDSQKTKSTEAENNEDKNAYVRVIRNFFSVYAVSKKKGVKHTVYFIKFTLSMFEKVGKINIYIRNNQKNMSGVSAGRLLFHNVKCRA
jgi:hypothetical protein